MREERERSALVDLRDHGFGTAESAFHAANVRRGLDEDLGHAVGRLGRVRCEARQRFVDLGIGDTDARAIQAVDDPLPSDLGTALLAERIDADAHRGKSLDDFIGRQIVASDQALDGVVDLLVGDGLLVLVGLLDLEALVHEVAEGLLLQAGQRGLVALGSRRGEEEENTLAQVVCRDDVVIDHGDDTMAFLRHGGRGKRGCGQ